MKAVKKSPGIVGVIINIIKTEGLLALWKGFVPTYCRIGPLTVLILVINEQFGNLYKNYVMK